MNQPVKNTLRILLATVAAGMAMAGDLPRELRVCADPDNFPFSNQQQEGFENKIAQVLAEDLRALLQYTWRPQRRGFIRDTLKAGLCDLVIGVPSGYDMVLSTKPYYSSTYVFVYAKDRNLKLSSFDDPVLPGVRIGVQAFGEDGANSPAVHALTQRGIVSNVVGFMLFGTADEPPGKIIDSVASGAIDVAIVWGPFAGIFAKRQPVALQVMPVSDRAPLPFVYDISMGVRIGDTAFREELEAVMDRRRGEIRKVLQSYGVPLVIR
jgi:mxaJ protein